jgi:AraC-like DNA-binding protein
MALVVGRTERARLAEALEKDYDLCFVTTLDELRTALTASERAVVIAEPRDQTGIPSAHFLRQLRAARPKLPLIGYCAVTRDESHDIVDLANAGVHELLFQHATDTPFLIQQTIRSAFASCASSTIAECVTAGLPLEIRTLVDYCLQYPKEATTVEAVARALGVHRKTLANYCLRAGVPVPGALVAWCRLLIAGQLLRTQTGTVETIALQLEFPSSTAFRNMLKRYAGLRPRDVRRPDGLDQLIALFRAAVLKVQAAAPTRHSA